MTNAALTQPIRVLQVIGSMDLGGVESMIMNLYRKIDRSKVQFDFLVRTPKKCAYDDEIIALGGRIHCIRPFKGTNPVSYYKECTRFFAEHPEYRVVHGHIGSSAALYLHAAKKAGCYTIAHSHSANTIRSLRDVAYTVCSYPTRYIAHQMFGCSTEAGISRYGKHAITQPNYRNFYNAIDLKAYQYDAEVRRQIREELGVAEDELLIGTVARISLPKNPELVYKVFKQIAMQNKKAKCVWVGSGELEQEYVAKIAAENLGDRILMTGRRDDIPAVDQGLDCFLLPSFFEGLPVSVIEAQAAGLPCVLSDTISREVDVSGLVYWCGLQTPPEKWAELCIEKAEQAKEERTSPIQAVRECGYDIDYVAEWLCGYYWAKVTGEDK